MVEKRFIDYLAEEYNVKQKNLIEKDLILQDLMEKLIKDKFFNENFIFKGGTCLIKCYLDYYRFSEDLDFTWRKQGLWGNKSSKQIRKWVSEKIARLAVLLNKVSSELKLDFKPVKDNKKYIELGSGGIFVTFKLWYASSISLDEQFVKIQINFIEKFRYKFKKCSAKNLFKKNDLKEVKFLFPEYEKTISKEIVIESYDIREILVEKIRAIITRRGVKTRDFIDVYFITRYLRENVGDYEEEIIEKILFALKYEKYLVNLLKKHDSFKLLKLEDKKDILLESLGKEFDKFLQDFGYFLDKLLEKIKKILKEDKK